MANNVVCKECNNLVNGWCEKAVDSPDPDMQRDCQHFLGKTNADRIRAMSDEELAKTLIDGFCCHLCKYKDTNRWDCPEECEKCCVEWLKQPAEE